MALNVNPAFATAGGSAWYYEDFTGSLCARLRGKSASKVVQGMPVLTDVGAEVEIVLDCKAHKVTFEVLPDGPTREIGGLPKEPLHFFVSVEDPQDAWEVVEDTRWRYDYVAPFEIRAFPDINGPRTQHVLRNDEVFQVSRERRGEDGILYLKLSDGRGWVFETKPDFPALCVPLETGVRNASSQDEMKAESTDSGDMLTKIKRLGPAGLAAYGITEGGFWAVSIPVVAVSYRLATGEWPDFQDQEDLAKVFGTSFAFLNVARLAVPLRIGLAIGLAPWVDANIVRPYFPEQWEAWRRQCEDDPEQCDVLDDTSL